MYRRAAVPLRTRRSTEHRHRSLRNRSAELLSQYVVYDSGRWVNCCARDCLIAASSVGMATRGTDASGSRSQPSVEYLSRSAQPGHRGAANRYPERDSSGRRSRNCATSSRSAVGDTTRGTETTELGIVILSPFGRSRSSQSGTVFDPDLAHRPRCPAGWLLSTCEPRVSGIKRRGSTTCSRRAVARRSRTACRLTVNWCRTHLSARTTTVGIRLPEARKLGDAKLAPGSNSGVGSVPETRYLAGQERSSLSSQG